MKTTNPPSSVCLIDKGSANTPLCQTANYIIRGDRLVKSRDGASLGELMKQVASGAVKIVEND